MTTQVEKTQDNGVDILGALQRHWRPTSTEKKTHYGFKIELTKNDDNINCVRLYNAQEQVFAEITRIYYHQNVIHGERFEEDKDDHTVNLQAKILADGPIAFQDKSGSDQTLSTLQEMVEQSYLMLARDEQVPVTGDRKIRITGRLHNTAKILFVEAEKGFLKFHQLKDDFVGGGNSFLKCGPKKI